MGRSRCIHLICQSVSGFVRQVHCALATYVLEAPQVHRTGNERWRRGIGYGGRSRGTGRGGGDTRTAAAFIKRFVVVAIRAPGVVVLHDMFAGEDVGGIAGKRVCEAGRFSQFRAVILISCGVHHTACSLEGSKTNEQQIGILDFGHRPSCYVYHN